MTSMAEITVDSKRGDVEVLHKHQEMGQDYEITDSSKTYLFSIMQA